MKHLTCAPLWGRLVALETNIRLERLSRYKRSRLLQTFTNYGCGKFYNIDARTQVAIGVAALAGLAIAKEKIAIAEISRRNRG